MPATYPGTCRAEQVGVNAPGKPKMTMRLPLTRSTTWNAAARAAAGGRGGEAGGRRDCGDRTPPPGGGRAAG